ncbi:MAG: DUF4388 domain-containing protein, partial [Thermoanaerobaculia bacterium]
LSDSVSAGAAAEPISRLLGGPTEVLATELEDWVRSESRHLRSLQTLPALIFYAVHKLVFLGEVGLVDWDQIQEAAEAVKGRLVRICPPELASQLRLDLGRLGPHRSHQAVPKAEKGEAAAAVRPAAPGRPAPLEGSLKVLSLTDLLSTMEASRTSGVLTLLDGEGAPLARLWLRDGAMTTCRFGQVEGPDAFWRLLEEPRAESFRLTRPSRDDLLISSESHSIRTLLLEGMRRRDELEFARGLLPDGAVLRATGVPPTPGQERDGAFVRDLWLQATAGASPAQCEKALGADAYRIRSLLVHWLREGALEIEYRPTLGPR